MIAKKLVDQFAYNSRVGRDVAERDIVLSYVLKVLEKARLLNDLAFKGGTCLRKTLFGGGGRFSMDLDFTGLRHSPDDWEARVGKLFEGQTHYDISFRASAWRPEHTGGALSYGCDIGYYHAWNSDTLKLEISMRERPVLEPTSSELLEESYWKFMEFGPFPVPRLRSEELLAEKIRAALERTRSRDLFDLFLFAGRPYDRQLARGLAVEKAWNARLPFDPDRLIGKFEREEYDWEDLETLVPAGRLPPRRVLVRTVVEGYSYLRDLDHELRLIANDARRHRLRDKVEQLRRSLRITTRGSAGGNPRGGME